MQGIREQMRDQYRGCLLGLAVGDALGMSVEGMTREEILAATEGKGVKGFLAPITTAPWAESIRMLRPGQWTDDTQLTRAIARSLIQKRGFDLVNIVVEHVVEFRQHRRGWGDSTRIGIQELVEWKRKPGDPVLDPKALGTGNGVAMKVAPLALLYNPATCADWFERLAESVYQLASLTHRDPCAAAGALHVAMWIASAIRPPELDEFTYASMGEPFSATSPFVDQRLFPKCPSHRKQLRETLDGLPLITPDRVSELPDLLGNSSFVLESVPFVLAMALSVHHFTPALLATVNAGGDTDSNAAMLGALHGAMHGISEIPVEWRDDVEARGEIIALADQLFEVANPKIDTSEIIC
ncbi:ADP-ribosylglycohydrolase family protein [Candidatus Uhrbacteria bacterium]|nr:ADP-ribosylglycohydrolase family protein [Candidatus Uhrbacteria bacterium]